MLLGPAAELAVQSRRAASGKVGLQGRHKSKDHIILQINTKRTMQNVVSMPSAAHVNLQALCKLFALNICCFLVNLLFVAFCALFSTILWVKLDFIGINRVTCVKRGVILGNIECRRGNKAVMFLKQ